MTIGKQIAEAIWEKYGRHLGNEAHANQDKDAFVQNVAGMADLMINAKEAQVGGSYDMPDGRAFWMDGPVAREIMRRVISNPT